MTTLGKYDIIDAHAHLMTLAGLDRMVDHVRRQGFERMNLLSIVDPTTGNGNSTVLAAKLLHPECFYGFGGLNHAAAISDDRVCGASLARQALNLIEAGCDGIKMLETKPTSRQKLQFPIDGPYYHEYFACVEERQVPLLWHVADPEEFWDPKTTPWWALKENWGYGPQDVEKEKLYTEVGHVLSRHPDLRVLFAHMYFLSANLPRLARFLRTYPNVSIDLALGVEMLFNMSVNPQESRQFFIDHADRIIFGTDIAAGLTSEQTRIRTELPRRFLETDETFSVPKEAEDILQTPGEIRGLALPAETLKKIYHDNFAAFAGAKPKPVDRGLAIEECRCLGSIATRLSGLPLAETEAGKCLKALGAE